MRSPVDLDANDCVVRSGWLYGLGGRSRLCRVQPGLDRPPSGLGQTQAQRQHVSRTEAHQIRSKRQLAGRRFAAN